MEVKYLEMSFKTASGGPFVLRANGVKDDIAEAEIVAAMDYIVANNPFVSKGGKLVKKVGAQLISRNVDELIR